MNAITLRLAVVVTLGLASPAFPALAHPGHHAPSATIEKSAAEAKAKTVVQTMIGRAVLDATWNSLNPVAAELSPGEDGLEWVVVFRNDKVKDPAKRTLYVILSSDGGYLAANYTGQ